MNRNNSGNFFDVNEIAQRIKVQKPYFAFKQLWQEDNALVGQFYAEQPLIHETGLITAGELGRHLAILGSCSAVALHNGPEGYYLATKAHFIRKPNRQVVAHEIYHASARVLNIDKRSLRVSAQAWNNEPVAELICEYTILSPALFQRNFRHYGHDNHQEPSFSPYQHPVPLHNLNFEAKKLVASAGPLSPEQCAGHFYGFPCWPVAIISQTAFQVIGALLNKQYGSGTRFCVKDTQLSAEKLIGANSVLTFSVETQPQDENPGLIKSIVNVFHGDEVAARLINQLEIIPAG